MTKDEANAASTVIFGVFCAAMLGVYWWSCWKANRGQDQLRADLTAMMARPRPPQPAAKRKPARTPRAAADGAV